MEEEMLEVGTTTDTTTKTMTIEQTISLRQITCCQMCHLAKLTRQIYTSHMLGNMKYTQLSPVDEKRLSQNYQLANILDEDDVDEVTASSKPRVSARAG